MNGIYGALPPQLAQAVPGAQQVSPLYPGAADLGEAGPGSYAGIAMLAPAGTLERRHAMAQSLLALAPLGEFTVMAPKDKGGTRLAKELAAFGCGVAETSKAHHRICTTRRPAALTGIEAALNAGGPRRVAALGLWSQPGVFSWERIDPGSALLAARLPSLQGQGADFGCGIGYLAIQALHSAAITRLDLIDIDRRAVAAAQRNVLDPRARIHWGDAASGPARFSGLDFVIMNPPFHLEGAEDTALGQAFIRSAARSLRRGGSCWLVANRHLPYEAALAAAFASVRLDHEAHGFKVFEARA